MISRKRTALAAATLLLGGGLALLPAAGASAAPASATAYSCHYKQSDGYEYAGHYTGLSVVPSSTTVTSAGIEAQCLLKRMHAILPDVVSSPGTVDGIFGTNSKASMRDFQRLANTWDAHLTVDGLPGTQSWPWLRSLTV